MSAGLFLDLLAFVCGQSKHSHRIPGSVAAEERCACDAEEGIRGDRCFSRTTISIAEEGNTELIAVRIPGYISAGLK